jgi:hypothetical protein
LGWKCYLKQGVQGKIEGRIEVTGENEEDVDSYRKFKAEALDRTLWRTGFGRGC